MGKARLVSKRSTISTEAVALPLHCESQREVRAPSDVAFSYLDDHSRLTAHMSRSSWMMAGARMKIELDASLGRAVGSRIRLSGRVLGVPVSVEEVVTERQPPLRKVWQTTGVPRAPGTPLARWLGGLLAAAYARWCTDSMADDAAKRFA